MAEIRQAGGLDRGRELPDQIAKLCAVLTEQQPASIMPITSCDGHAGSGVPAAGFTQVLAAPAASVNIASADPKVAPHPLSGKQHGDSGTSPLLGTVHIAPPHMIDTAAPDPASPLTSVMA